MIFCSVVGGDINIHQHMYYQIFFLIQCKQFLPMPKMWVQFPFANKYNLAWILKNPVLELELWYLTPLSTIYQLYRGGQFYWWRKSKYPLKTTNLSHNVVSSTPSLSGIWITNNICGDKHWLHRSMEIKLPCDHEHDGIKKKSFMIPKLKIISSG